MKTLLILLAIALAKGDKLNTLYLPPIGANYSGGSSGDIEIPFQVPVERYTSKNEQPNLVTPGFEPNRDFGGKGSAISAPTGVPSTTSKSVSYSTTPLDDRRNYNQVSQELTRKPFNNVAYNPTEYPAYYNSDKNIPSIGNVQNQFENINTADASDYSFSSNPIEVLSNNKNAGKAPVNSEQIVIPENVNYVRYPERVIRPQAEADRNAVILNYNNVITPEGFSYSYDTSNGIHADESGTATDGVKANGSYSYIGDDGKLYNITYSADENGFQPRGDHLPTSPPIPDAILKVIEQAAKDKVNGVFDDGSYDENKYGYQKYQTPQDRILTINNPRLVSTRRNNSGSYKQPQNGNNNDSRIGNLKPGDQNNFVKSTTIPPFYTSDGSRNYDFNTPSSNDQDDIYDNGKQKTDNILQIPSKSNSKGLNEPEKTFERKYYQNQDYNKSDLPNVFNQENESGYEYNVPKNNFESDNIDTVDPENFNTFHKNKGIPTYNTPYIATDDVTKGSNEPTNNENRLNESENGYTYPNTDYQFGQRIPSQTSTSGTLNSPYSSITSKPFRLPQRITQSPPVAYDVKSGNPRLSTTYEPQSYQTSNKSDNQYHANTYPSRNNIKPSENLDNLKTYNNNYSSSTYPSSTERLKQIATSSDQPSDFYGPASTERIKQFDSYTGRPNDFYAPSSTERIKQIDSYTGRPNDYYGPSSTDRIKQIDSYTGRPNDYYGPSSTERIKQIDSYTGRPNDYYGPSSTERIKQIDSYTGRPNDYYGPSSTEIIKQIDSYTDQPKDLYRPTSTENIIGEDFSGPKQSQSYDPETGYHY